MAAVALKALPTTPIDVDVLTLRGRADMAQGNLGAALDALRRADSVRKSFPLRRAIPEASEHDLGMSIADVYRAAGNHSAAIREYARLLNTSPKDSTVVLRVVQSLRVSGHHLAALDSAVRALSRFRGYAALRDEAVNGVRDIFDFTADSVAKLVVICERDAQIRRECANSLADHGADFSLDGEAPARVRAFLSAASQLGASDSTTTTRRNIALAMSFIGHPAPVESAGVLTLHSDAFQRDSMVHYLGLVESLTGAPMSDTTHERLHRARAYRAGLTGDYLQGLNEAEKGYHILPNRDDALLGTLLATILASHARSPATGPPGNTFLRQWNRDAQTRARALIDSAAQRFPDEESVLIARARFCSDYAIDHECSFEANSLRMSKGMVSSNLDILDAVESAIVVDRYATALQWLKRTTPGSFTGCTRTVAGLYEVWASSSTGAMSTEAFAKWKAGIAQYRASKEWKCWVFEGAKARLRESPSVPNAATLAAMIFAFEDPSAPIPTWPGERTR
jgi:tetratricopeptide (TPR) repeat protein